MWLLTTMGLALGALCISVLTIRGWRNARQGVRQADHGRMSEQWLAEHRAGR